MSADDVDRQVTDHLARLAERGEAPETIGEIAEQLALSAAQVRASMWWLASYGGVRQVGVARSRG